MSLLSVIIPVHNTVAYLENTLDSVLKQSLSDIEIILVENMSTDGSDVLCDKLAGHDSRIKVMHNDIAGLSRARNAGIKASTSDYVAFIDSDDTIEHDMYEKMYEQICHYDADIAVCNYDMIFDDGTSKKLYKETGCSEFLNTKEFTYNLLKETICSSACVGLYRKDLFVKDMIMFPEDRFYEDRALTYLLAANARRGGVWIQKTMYHYYQRPRSISHSLDFEKLSHHCQADMERCKFVMSSGMFPDRYERKPLLDYIVWSFFWAFDQIVPLADTACKKKSVMDIRRQMLRMFSFFPVLSSPQKKNLWRLRLWWPYLTGQNGC